MKPKSLMLTLFITFMLVVIAALWTLSEHSAVQELTHEQEALLQQTKEIGSLKTRWSTQEAQSDVDFLKNHPNLVKQEKRGGDVYFDYENLSMSEFDRLSNRILNSMLVIKKLTLRRNGTSKGIITVEIES